MKRMSWSITAETTSEKLENMGSREEKGWVSGKVRGQRTGNSGWGL